MNKRYIVLQAQLFKLNFSDEVSNIDFDLKGINKVERHINNTVSKTGTPSDESFFYEDFDQRVFWLACFMGEVLRRKVKKVAWAIAPMADYPQSIYLINSNKIKSNVLAWAIKRMNFGHDYHLGYYVKDKIEDFKRYGKVNTLFFDKDDNVLYEAKDSEVCLVTNNVYEGLLDVESAAYGSGIWLIKGENEENGVESEDSFEYLFLSEVKNRFPELYSIMKTRKSKTAKIEKAEDGSFQLEEAYSGLFVDDSAMASNQGNMKFNPVQWTKMNPKGVLVLKGTILLSIYAMLQIHWAFVIVVLAGILYALRYWFGKKGLFVGGDVNPGKVLSLNPDRIAVATNMSKFGIGFPIVKIFKTNLRKQDKVIGKYIPTIAFYKDNVHNYPFWAEFDPVPVSHGINDQAKLDELMTTFSESDYDELDEFISQVDFESDGVFKINPETSGWKDYDHVDMNKGLWMKGPPEEKKEKKIGPPDL